METASFIPQGPAESPRVRAFAERSLSSIPQVNLRDKAKYLIWMGRLNNHILGKDEDRKRARNINKVAPSSSSPNFDAYGDPSASSSNMNMNMNITADMRIASTASLDKIRKLRSSFETFAYHPSDAQLCAEENDEVRAVGKSVDWADRQTIPSKETNVTTTSSNHEILHVDRENIPEKINQASFTVTSSNEGKEWKVASGLVEVHGSKVGIVDSGRDTHLQSEDIFETLIDERKVKASSDDHVTESDNLPDSLGELSEKEMKSDSSDLDGFAIMHETTEVKSTSVFEPKVNDKGEVDISGSWRAPQAIRREDSEGAPLPASSVSIAKSNAKKSLDLSGLSLDELKELQGHY